MANLSEISQVLQYESELLVKYNRYKKEARIGIFKTTLNKLEELNF